MTEFLLELFSEEIPARMQKRAAGELNKLIIRGLKQSGLTFDFSLNHVTPHRFCIMVSGLTSKQPDMRDERRGPRVGAPDIAIQGFLRSVGLNRNDLEARETDKGKFLFAVVETPGEETKLILPKIIETAIRELPWPKSMRWGSNSFRWIRPLHHVMAIFDEKRLEGNINLGDGIIEFTNTTKGHRFLAPQLFEVTSFSDYQTKLYQAYVILDREERKSRILEQSKNLVEPSGLKMKDDEILLEEVCGLVEWPNSLMGTIKDEFMDIPAEALVCSMRSHQKYFSIETSSGDLSPRFITVSNMPSDVLRDQTIVVGNEKVLRARLSDARFFWDQDRELPLETRISALANVTFYDKLGSLGEKMIRVEKLGLYLSDFVLGAKAGHIKRAAQLAKADLTTSMVGEFPELQGVMGSYYARHDGEDPMVCKAIMEHYSPQGPSDNCPTNPVSVILSLADKLDTLVGFFSVNEKPTGSKDPFALRRSALGLIRLIMENGLRLPLEEIITKALSLYPQFNDSNLLIDFIAERLKVHLRTEGVRHDLITAVFSVGNEDDLNRIISRVKALGEFLLTDDGKNLLIAHRRAANMVSIEFKRNDISYASEPESSLFELDQERKLSKTLDKIRSSLPEFLKKEDFTGAMQALATLRQPVDEYFQNVTVNSKKTDLRENRLKTLSLIVKTMNAVADFSAVEG
jgi:glycyl-tRNA synthetase beta chain